MACQTTYCHVVRCRKQTRHPMQTTPVSLLERLRGEANPQAWERFVDLYTPLLYKWARRVGLDAADAADLVQDVLTKLVETLPTFAYDRNRSFRAWLRTVTLNRWRESCRRQFTRPHLVNGMGLDEAAAP